MKLFDRYLNKQVEQKQLPNKIDLGRFCFGDGQTQVELCKSALQQQVQVDESLLSESNSYMQEVFKQMYAEEINASEDSFLIKPFIQGIAARIQLNEFEKTLKQHVQHLEQIFRKPSNKLSRKELKSSVAQAKRITHRSFNYLSSHSEDWQHRSIVSFAPARVVHEVLDEDYNIYENQLAKLLLDRLLRYLKARRNEIQDTKEFLENYSKLVNQRDDEHSWYKKIYRNLSLIGSVYSNSETDNKAILGYTEYTVRDLFKRLVKLKDSFLYQQTNSKKAKTVSFKNTNLLINDKHYRYIKILWLELNKQKPESTEEKIKHSEQEVIKGLRTYLKSIFSYCIANQSYLDIELKGNYKAFEGKHSIAKIAIREDQNGVISLQNDNHITKYIVVGNKPDRQTFKGLPNNTILCYWSSDKQPIAPNGIAIHPFDADSVERIAVQVRKQMLLDTFAKMVRKEMKYDQKLRDYLHLIEPSLRQQLSFVPKQYTYRIKSYFNELNTEHAIPQVVDLANKKEKRRRTVVEGIRHSAEKLVVEAKQQMEQFSLATKKCPICSTPISWKPNQAIDAIECINPDCRCRISVNEQQIEFTLGHNKFRGNKEDLGMDYFHLATNEL